jgi:hypothetical protein
MDDELRVHAEKLDLLCPECDGDAIQHAAVHVYHRREDAKEGHHVMVCPGEVTTMNDLVGNPSARRGGVTIDFTCENCGANFTLCLAQHKGRTFVFTR